MGEIIEFLMKFNGSLDRIKKPVCTIYCKYFVVGLDTLYAFTYTPEFKFCGLTASKKEVSTCVASGLVTKQLFINAGDDKALEHLHKIIEILRKSKEDDMATIIATQKGCTTITNVGHSICPNITSKGPDYIDGTDVYDALCFYFKTTSDYANELQ